LVEPVRAVIDPDAIIRRLACRSLMPAAIALALTLALASRG
jgi:hypothetical protein